MFAMPDLHDGFVDGLYLAEDKCVYLFIRTHTGERSTVVSNGVEALNVVNFRAGNIIFDTAWCESGQLTIQTSNRFMRFGRSTKRKLEGF
jgi:hypothetical protein